MLKRGVRGKLFISIVFVVISANFIKSTFDVMRSRQRLEDAEKREQELILEKDILKRQVEYKNSQEYIEESARNELNMVKPGEKVYVLSQEAVAETTQETTVAGVSDDNTDTSGEDGDHPNWYYWYRLFF